MSKLSHASWFEAYYRTATREGRYGCRSCGRRVVGLFDRSSELLTTTLVHVQRCNPSAVVGLVTIDGEQRPAAIMNHPLRIVMPAPEETPCGAVFDRVRPLVSDRLF